MTFAEPSFDTDLDVEGFKPTEAETLNIASEVDRIRPLIEEFPTQILHINLEYNSNSGEYEVKLALVLPGQTFATGDVSEAWEPSLEKSVQKMIRRIEHYKATMSGELEWRQQSLPACFLRSFLCDFCSRGAYVPRDRGRPFAVSDHSRPLQAAWRLVRAASLFGAC